MLENLVAWVLNNYVGEYLENLNTDQLSIALLQGQVELENVPLKKTALRKFDIPVEVKGGVLGKLTLSVPLTHIRSEPWVLKLSDVLILLGPAKHKCDVQVVERYEQTKKEQMLDELEAHHRRELAQAMGVPMSASTDNSWWGASLISTVVNNIQLILTNVHIRYEDDIAASRGLGFNCGVRIQKCSVQTTDSGFNPGFVEPRDGENVFKKLELCGLSIYWNSDQAPAENLISVKDLQNYLSPENRNADAFILEPMNLDLKMEKNSSKFPLKSIENPIPRFKPDRVTLELNRRQMAEMRALGREWARFERGRQHRKWRPPSEVKDGPREWWLFAQGRIVEERRRTHSRHTWNFALARAKHLNAYARAYKRRLLVLANNPTMSVADSDSASRTNVVPDTRGSEDKVIMRQIERDAQYTYNELHLLRETVFRRLVREAEVSRGLYTDESMPSLPEDFETVESPDNVPSEPPKAQQSLYGWFSSFFTAAESVEEKKDEEGELDATLKQLLDLKSTKSSEAVQALEKQLEGEILDVLHESWDDSTLLRRDVLLAQLTLVLQHLTLRFVDDEAVGFRSVLALDLKGLTGRVELSPKQHWTTVSLLVSDMSVQRLETGGGKESFEEDSLMYSKGVSMRVLFTIGRNEEEESEETKKLPFFKMIYSRRAPRLTVRETVHCVFRPLSIMYDKNAMKGISELFRDDDYPAYETGDEGSSGSELRIQTDSMLVVSLEVPVVCLELRQKPWTIGEAELSRCDGSTGVEGGSPFACIRVDDVFVSMVNKETHLTKLKVGVGSLTMEDLFEQGPFPLLLSTSSKELITQKCLSSSCPDLSMGLQHTPLSKSLPMSALGSVERRANVHRKTSGSFFFHRQHKASLVDKNIQVGRLSFS